MKYIFHLGRVPALSVAEIQTIFKKVKVNFSIDLISSKFLILDIKNKINPDDLLVEIGGIIKIARVLGEYENPDEALKKTISAIEELNKRRSSKKIIGYSIYFTQNKEKDKVLEISEKIRNNFSNAKKLRSKDLNLRIVFPGKNMELNSASVFKNKIIKKGMEFNFLFLPACSMPPLTPPKRGRTSVPRREEIVPPLLGESRWDTENKIILSKTVAVQDIESYSERDYDRPKRNPKIGIIPPKLAQIMINLAQIKKGEVLLDPFCGIGTILQEALLNDYKVVGSDANGDQIANCKENLEWLSKKYILKYPDYKIFQSDMKNITRKIKPNSIDAIVTESTLGPIYKKVPNKAEIGHNYNRFIKMYTGFFQIAKLILRKNKRIIITIPAYKTKNGGYATAPFIDRLEKIGYSVISPLDREFIIEDIKTTDRNSIIYDRPNQIVAREVLIFKNK